MTTWFSFTCHRPKRGKCWIVWEEDTLKALKHAHTKVSNIFFSCVKYLTYYTTINKVIYFILLKYKAALDSRKLFQHVLH